jgi:hypothetical protein
MAAISEEGENNREWHQSVELRTVIMSENGRNTEEDVI